MRKLGEKRDAWGDFIRLDELASLDDAAQLIIEQMVQTILLLHQHGKIEFPVHLGWKVNEIGEEDILAAKHYLNEEESLP